MWLPMYPAPPVTRIFMMLCLLRAVEPPRAGRRPCDGEKLIKNTILRFRAEIKRKTGFFRKKAVSRVIFRETGGQKYACPGAGDDCVATERATEEARGATAGRQAVRARRHPHARIARITKILTFFRVRLDFFPARDYNILYPGNACGKGIPAERATEPKEA